MPWRSDTHPSDYNESTTTESSPEWTPSSSPSTSDFTSTSEPTSPANSDEPAASATIELIPATSAQETTIELGPATSATMVTTIELAPATSTTTGTAPALAETGISADDAEVLGLVGIFALCLGIAFVAAARRGGRK